jgi:hypothetical protein
MSTASRLLATQCQMPGSVICQALQQPHIGYRARMIDYSHQLSQLCRRATET